MRKIKEGMIERCYFRDLEDHPAKKVNDAAKHLYTKEAKEKKVIKVNQGPEDRLQRFLSDILVVQHGGLVLLAI